MFNCPSAKVRHSHRGIVLVSSMVLLFVLTIVAVSGMQSTTGDFRMSRNLAFKERSFQSSESGRNAFSSVLTAHVFERGWPASIILPAGLSILDKDNLNGPDNLYLSNGLGENLLVPSSLTTDATYTLDNNGDLDFDDGGDINASIVVYQLQSGTATGSGTAISSGYEGLGKSLASGGFHVYFELRSRGMTSANAQSTTATGYRVVTN